MDDQQLQKIRHSTSHILAYAVKEIFGSEVKFAIGPTIDDGFYYDFDLSGQTFSTDDLKRIEKKMMELIKKKSDFNRTETDIKTALEKTKAQPYKQELINDLAKEGEKNVSFYQVGEFEDLCRGPHVENTKELGHFKLLKIAGAYWRGDEKNKMLQRIYGTAFKTKDELQKYLIMLAEAEKRDHKKLGRELDLFSFQEEGPGFPFFHDKGTIIWNALVDFMRQEMKKRNYEENKTPIILNEDLWRTSGHWDHYKESMYFTTIDEKKFAVKPMNCPGNLLIYKTNQHSYKDLPIKAGEFGLVHRHEKSGVLNGLFRVRNFTQDDAHIFCTADQLKEQIIELIDFVDFIYKTFGFKYLMELSTKPEKAMGSKETWDKAESALKEVLKEKNIEFKINEGDGAFYGPKIDFHLKDAIGRTWQCGTIQLDFSMPEKFDLEYTGEDGKKHRPIMLHRAIYGSIERFLGILIEHYAGAFPLWLSPVQIIVIPISEKFAGYGHQVMEKFKRENIRVKIDDSNESLGKRIRNAEKEKIPYIVVVGEKEQGEKTLAIRKRGEGDLGSKKIDDFMAAIKTEITDKK
ncbi:MAG: threonine--tRNA ligase [Candidatus Buchananbacteria bacterium]|nr:threonine--tRNA ligase [Candidatus Buchananbacteria bacterium]